MSTIKKRTIAKIFKSAGGSATIAAAVTSDRTYTVTRVDSISGNAYLAYGSSSLTLAQNGTGTITTSLPIIFTGVGSIQIAYDVWDLNNLATSPWPPEYEEITPHYALDAQIPSDWSVFKRSDGTYFTNADWDELRPDTTGWTTYYIDPINGSDSAAGTSTTAPLKGLYTAIGKAGNKVLKCKRGTYSVPDSGTALAWYGRNLITSCIIEPWDEGTDPIISSMHVNNLSWQLASGYTRAWKSTSARTLSVVYDAKYPDEYGDFYRYPAVASIALVDSTPGSYFISGSDIYVNCIDGRSPDSDLRVFIAGSTVNGKFNDVLGTGSVLWMRDIQFHGGQLAFSTAEVPAASPKRQLIMQNCEFGYTDLTKDCFAAKGGMFVTGVGCRVVYSDADGWDFHDFSGTTSDNNDPVTSPGCTMFLWDCDARHCGYTAANDQSNCMTSHSWCNGVIGNGVFYDSKGPCQADVVNCSINYFGIQAGGNRATISDWTYDYLCGYDGVSCGAAYYGCRSIADTAALSLFVDSNSTILSRDFDHAGKGNVIEGTVI